MAIGDDFSVAANGDIRYTGTTNNYTVIAFHRWLGDLMDDAQASGNDILDITDATASERSTDNIITLKPPYNIDDEAAQHLYDGSVIQDNGDTIYDGILVFGASGMYLEIIQNGELVTPNFWTNGLNADPAAGISHRFMLKVRTGGADIDGRRIIGITREFGKTYSEFKATTARGNNVLALTYADDLNNVTPAATVAGWTTITNQEGYRLIDINNDGTDEPYYSEWNRSTYTINQLYERTKWLTRRGSTSTLYGLNGQIFRGVTHQIAVSGSSGTWSAVEKVTWTGGTGQMLAIDSTTNPSKMWIQLLTGVVPSNQTITGATSGATATSGTVTERPISTPFIGASTGTAIIGAYGLGIEYLDLSASDKLTDLDNALRVPPNLVTFTVLGLVPGEDRVLLGPEAGGGLQENQLTLATSLSGSAETQAVMTTTIPSDTPESGTIRIKCNSGIFRRVAYSSFSGSTFTFASSEDFSADPATQPKDVFISYIDKLAGATSESVTWVYAADRSVFLRVRDGGATPIKTFETTGIMGIAGGSATVIRTSDT